MTLFLLVFFIIIAIILRCSKYLLLCEPLFWIFIFWTFIIGVYFTAGISYIYGFSINLFLYLSVCLVLFIKGRQTALRKATKVFATSQSHMNTKTYILMGLIGVIAFSWDYIRLNGLATSKVSSNISLIGSVGSLFVPLLLLMGLYLNANSIKSKGRFSLLGVLLIFAYSVPCMINAGRETILFGLIGMMCLYSYNKRLYSNGNETSIRNSGNAMRKYLLITMISGVAIYLSSLIIQISQTRFTDNEINVLLTKRNISNGAIQEASSWGTYEFLYYNIASYFSHQIPFLEFTLREYDGPYLLGMYELNIISRRLPDILNLDYKLAFQSLNSLYFSCGESYSGAWNTVLGSFIIDFTWIGSFIGCWYCGYGLGKFNKKFEATLDVRYATMIALLCLSSFSTIQLGPFYQTQIYGAYIWWWFIFRKEEIISLE